MQIFPIFPEAQGVWAAARSFPLGNLTIGSIDHVGGQVLRGKRGGVEQGTSASGKHGWTRGARKSRGYGGRPPSGRRAEH